MIQQSREKRNLRARVTSAILAFVMVVSVLPAMSLRASAASTELTPTTRTLNGGDYTLKGGNYSNVALTTTGTTTIRVAAGTTVQIDNRAAGGSPITVSSGTLNLIVDGTLVVYGKNATDGIDPTGTAFGVAGDIGYAGINVSTGKTLIISGNGTVRAYGGDAGDGGDSWPEGNSNKGGGQGGAGAGAGIGGNGGKGGAATDASKSEYYAFAGENGAAAGNITLLGSVTVWAYGGSGGSGGVDRAGDAGGAGGYPAAGIGGGGGGGAEAHGGGGAGGFSAGGQAWGGSPAVNGAGANTNDKNWMQTSGGYFSAIPITTGTITTTTNRFGQIGGGGAEVDNGMTYYGANGGAGGAGGNVTISCLPGRVHAYNGSYITTAEGTTNITSEGVLTTQTPIYAQLGYSLSTMRSMDVREVTGRGTSLTFIKYVITNNGTSAPNVSKSNVTVNKTVATTPYGLGIGSGAGYTETGNGTVTYGWVDVNMSTVTSNQTLTPRTDGKVYHVFGSSSNYNVTVSGGKVPVIFDELTINMQAKSGSVSAVSVASGAELVAEVRGTTKLYGGSGGSGAAGESISGESTPGWGQPLDGGSGGAGGGAGIAVPVGATLLLEGGGTLYAYGGDAGDGGAAGPRAGAGAGGYPAAGIGGGGGGAGGGGGWYYKTNGYGYGGGGGGGGGAGAGIGGIGGAGGTGGGSNIGDYNGYAGDNGSTGGGAGTITVNVRLHAYGGGGGSGGNSNGGHGWTSSYFSNGGTNGNGEESHVSSCGGASGAGGFSAGGSGSSSAVASGYFSVGTYLGTDPIDKVFFAPVGGYSTAIGSGGTDDTTVTGNTPGGNGGAGGAGGVLITIIDKTLTMAQNGSKITTSTSSAQGYASANTTVIKSQATQGYGAGAGLTETNGTIVFMGSPGAPTDVGAALSGDYGEKVKVTWTPPTNDGGSAVTSYTIVSSEFGINETVTVAQCAASGGTLSYELPNVPANTAGKFVVYANNIKGSSAPSADSNSVTTKGTPLETRDVEAKNVTTGSDATVRVLWSAPDVSYNNNNITKYHITFTPIGIANSLTAEELDCIQEEQEGSGQPSNVPSPAPVKTVTVAALDLPTSGGRYYTNVTGLERGTVYNVTVKAENGAGIAEGGGQTKVETYSGAMAPEVTVERKDEAANDLTVTWTEPENARTEGLIPALSGYTVTRTAVDENKNAVAAETHKWTFTSNDSRLEIRVVDGVRTFTFTDNTLGSDALNGRTYTYTVTGDNLTGAGEEGAGAYSYAPVSPTNVTRKPNTTLTNSLTVQWTAPVENGNDPVTEYHIYRDGEQVGSVPADTLFYKDETVEKGETYKYTVVAVNGDGEGLFSTPELELRANGVPERPATMTAVATGATSATVTWSAPTEKTGGGLPGTGGYQPDGTTALVVLRYQVKWVNQTNGNVGSVELPVVFSGGYYVPADNSGVPVELVENKYTLCLNPEAVESQRQYFTFDPSSEQYTYTVRNMAQGSVYELSVAAINEVGTGVVQTRPATTWNTPGRPGDLKIDTNSSDGQLTATWTASTPNGTAVTQYAVTVYAQDDYLANGDAATKVDWGTVPASGELKYTTTKLPSDGGRSYAVVVVPYNELGPGERAVGYNTSVSVPGAPTTVSATPYAQDRSAWITAKWGDVEHNGGSEITRYEVQVYRYTVLGDPNGGETQLTYGTPQVTVVNPATGETVLTYSSGVTVTYPRGQRDGRTATIEGLEGWQDYRISVRAYNAANDQLNNDEATATIPGAVRSIVVRTPSAPTAVQGLKVSATGGKGELEVNWRAPLETGGADITWYYLELYEGEWNEEQIEAGHAKDSLITSSTDRIQVNGNTMTYTFKGLVNGTTLVNGVTYTVRVLPRNSVGIGNGATATGAPAQGADAPTHPAVHLLDGTSLEFTWTNPVKTDNAATDGFRGGTLKGYQVTLTDGNGAVLYTMTTDAKGTITSTEASVTGVAMELKAPAQASGGQVTVKVTGLTMGGQYRLRANITTVELEVPGAPSEQVPFRMWTKPGAPSAIKVVPTVKDQGLKVQWSYPYNDGDSDNDPNTNGATNPDIHTGVTGYRLYWRHEDAENWNLVQWGEDLNALLENTAQAGNEVDEEGVNVLAAHAIDSGEEDGVFFIHLNNLVDGDTYEFKVIAMNGAGWGEPDRVYTANPCSVPTDAEIGEVLTGDRSATITSISGHYAPGELVTVTDESGEEKQVLGNGGSPVTSYRIYAAPAVKNSDGTWGRGGEWVYKTTTSASETENVRVPDLENGTDYLIKVCAINAACTDEVENLGRAGSNWEYVRVGMPLRPENVKADLGIANSAIVTYDAAEGHGSPILYYKAYVAQLSGPDAEEPDESAYRVYTMQLVNGMLVDTEEPIQFTGQVATVYGATMGDTVSIKFTAVNAVGESPMSEAVRVTVGAPSIPNIRVLDKAKDSVHIEWTAANGNGARMMGYYVYLRNSETQQEYCYKVGAAQLALDVTADTAAVGEKAPLEKGIKYVVQVSAENLAGEGPRSEAWSFIFGVPQPPTINEVAFGEGKLDVTFTPPADTGGVLEDGVTPEPLTGFALYANGVLRELITTDYTKHETEGTGAYAGLTWKYVEANEDGTYTIPVGSLANGSTYSIRVSAINRWGEGDQSDAVSETPATSAGAPTNVLAVATSDTTAELSWRAPAYNGGSDIAGYVVTVCDAGGTAISDTTAHVEVNGTTAKVTGLTSGVTYRFKIQAQTKASKLGAASTTNAVTTFTLPGMPNITSWESKADSNGRYNLTVTWAAPSNTGGTELLGYHVYRGKVKVTATMLNPETHTYTISGLSYGASYDISVGAVNSVGETKTNPALTTRVGQLPAPVITSITTQTTDAQGLEADLTVRFQPVEGAVTGYYLFDLGDVTQFPTLAKADDPTTPDVEKIMSLTASELNTLLARSVQYHQQMGETTDLTSGEMTIAYQEVGKTCYLVLTAYSTAGGVGVPTAVHPVTIGAPDAPGLTAEAGYRKITANWTAPANLNLSGAELKGYQFYLDGAALGAMVTADELSGLVSGKGYEKELSVPSGLLGKTSELTVAAVTAKTGESGEAETLTGRPSEGVEVCPWDLPATPVSYEPVPGNASFTIQFEKADGRGLPIAGYRIYWDGMARADSSIQWKDNGDGTITATVTGIENGYKGQDAEGKDVGYPVYVEAYTVEANGTERKSLPEVDYTWYVATGIPAAPVITAVDADTGSINVSWENSAVSSTITQYTVYLTDVLTGRTESYTTTDETYRITSFNGAALASNRVYLVEVTATSTIGESARSESVSVRLGAPKAPGNVNAISGNGSVLVTWSAPNAVTGTIIKYHIYVVGEDGTTLTREVDRNTTAFTVDGLENGTKYSIQVTAENSVGEGVRSKAVTVVPGTAPGAPASAEAVAASDTAVKVTWTKPVDDGGLPVNYYTVRGGGRTVAVSASDFPADAESFTAEITGLTAGVTYTFTVTATNTAGTSEPCETNEVTTHTVPTAPMWEEVYSEDGDIVVMWKAPASAGGAEAKIESYTLYVRSYAGELLYTIDGIESDASNTDGNGVITYVIDGDSKGETPLELYTKYRVSVAAKNDSVDTMGPENDRFVVTIIGALAASKPGNPIELTAAAGDQQVMLNWKAPVRDGGGVDAYYIYYKVKDGEAARQSEPQKIRVDGSRLTETITSLVNGTTYEFYVTASNAQGESGPSLTEEAQPIRLSAPGAVKNLRYFNTVTGQTKILWDAPVTGDAPQKYKVKVTNLGTGAELLSEEVTGTTLQLSNLNPSLQYRIEVIASNTGGDSPVETITAMSVLNVDTDGTLTDFDRDHVGNLDADFDGVADPVDQVTAPSEPTDLSSQVNGAESITLTWTAPKNTGGTGVELSGYRIYINGTYEEIAAYGEDGQPVTSYTYTGQGGLKPGSVYTFQVSAMNDEAGEGARSATLQVYVQASDAPTNLQASAEGYTTLRLTWNRPQTPSKITGYYLQLNGKDDSEAIQFPEGTDVDALETLEYSASRLTPDSETVVRVFAKFENGRSGQYSEAKVVYTTVETPDAPVIGAVSATADAEAGLDRISVSWGAVEHATGYKVHVSVSGGEGKDITVGAEETTAELEFASAPGIYTAYVIAVNAPTGLDIVKESARSAAKSATTTPISDYAPLQVEGLTAVPDRGSKTVALTWETVEVPEIASGEDFSVTYIVYGGTAETGLKAVAMTEDTNATVDVELNQDYAFQVVAINVYSGSDTLESTVAPETIEVGEASVTGYLGLRSEVAEATTKSQVPVPGAPTSLSGSYNSATGEVTLTWRAPDYEGAVTGYQVYGYDETGALFAIGGLVTDGTSCTFPLSAVEGKTDYLYQVSAVVIDSSSGEDERIEGARSTAVTVSTKAPPAAPDAPTITRYVFSLVRDEENSTADKEVLKGIVKLYWKAPEDTSKPANANITAYTVLLENKEMTGEVAYNEETGEYFYTFDCNADEIFQGEVYTVAVRATAVVDGVTLNSGLQEKTYKIAYGNNHDTDGDGEADSNFDTDGDGVVEDVAVTVKLTGTIVAKSSDPNGKVTFTITDESGNEVSSSKFDVELNEDGSFTLSLKVDAAVGDGKYTLKVVKENCTSFTITDIPVSASTSSLELGTLTLLAGDVNGDDKINFLDKNIVNSNLNKNSSQGDINGDGKVNFLDKNVINSNLNKQATSISFSSI